MSNTNNYRAIQVLPIALANQIAAGEVIERPASCIKELLENSLDSGATEIHIDIDAGGMRQIVVTDNGAGIEKQDLILALSAHATSKIEVQQDLFNLTTLGFRGEALASIQAVSKVEIISKRPFPETKAYKIIAYEQLSIIEAHFSEKQGTMVIVKDLFYNVPARKKFLKSAKTEYIHIESLVTALALSHPEVAIYFNHNQKQVYYLPQAITAAQVQSRVAKLVGKNFIDHAIELNVERIGLVLTGFLGLPETFSRTNTQQYFYINGRLIKDKLITHAIKSFFQEKQLLGPGLYPAYVLYFTIAPEDVDVNVHPTKHEVRFHEPRLIHDFITSALASAVIQTGLISDPEEYEILEKKSELEKIEKIEKIEKTDRQDRFKQFNELNHPEKTNTDADTDIDVNNSKIAFLNKPEAPRCVLPEEHKLLARPMIKISQYLVFGETIENPDQGLLIDLTVGQVELLSYFLESHHFLFEAKPILVPLTIATPYTEQWVWPDRVNNMAEKFGLIYQFKQKKELLVTHLPQIAKYMTHQERIDSLVKLFQVAVYENKNNEKSTWQKILCSFFPENFLCRLRLEEWGNLSGFLENNKDEKFIRVIDGSFQ